MSARGLLVAALVTVLLGACGRLSDGIDAYEAGEFERAHEIFRAIDDAAGADAAAEIVHDRALAALAAGDLDDAEDAARRLSAQDDPAQAGLGHFLLGNVLFEKASLSARQARAVEAEPFAYEIAIRRAEDAAVAWCRAAATRDAWPAAARNANRALRLGETLRKEQRDAAANRPRKTAGGGTPRVRPIPVDVNGAQDRPDGPSRPSPPTPEPGGDTEEAAPSEVTRTELSQADMSVLLERLAAREREKRSVRSERRTGAQGGVEKDW